MSQAVLKIPKSPDRTRIAEYEYFQTSELGDPFPKYFRAKQARAQTSQLVFDPAWACRTPQCRWGPLRLNRDQSTLLAVVNDAKRRLIVCADLTTGARQINEFSEQVADLEWAEKESSAWVLSSKNSRPYKLSQLDFDQSCLANNPREIYTENREDHYLQLEKPKNIVFLVSGSLSQQQMYRLSLGDPPRKIDHMGIGDVVVEFNFGLLKLILTPEQQVVFEENQSARQIVRADSNLLKPQPNWKISNKKLLLNNIFLDSVNSFNNFWILGAHAYDSAYLFLFNAQNEMIRSETFQHSKIKIFPQLGQRSSESFSLEVENSITGKKKVEINLHTPLAKDGNNEYTQTSFLAPTHDGMFVPLSLAYKPGVITKRKILLHTYAAYGETSFFGSSYALEPFLDQGGVLANCHARGGGELGPQWRILGSGENKQNTISDYSVCAKYLREEYMNLGDKLIAHGKSAGGLAVAAALNQDPTLFDGAIIENPFLGVDKNFSHQQRERTEWGSLELRRKLSPIGNIRPASYPPLLIRTAIRDELVDPGDTLEYAQRLRELAKARVMVLPNFSASHHEYESSWDQLEMESLDFAFALGIEKFSTSR